MYINYDTMFTVSSETRTRGHQWKLCHKHSRVDQHKYFFAQRVVRPWNSLNITFDDWSSVAKFKTLIKKTDLSDFFVFSVTLSTVYIC